MSVWLQAVFLFDSLPEDAFEKLNSCSLSLWLSCGRCIRETQFMHRIHFRCHDREGGSNMVRRLVFQSDFCIFIIYPPWVSVSLVFVSVYNLETKSRDVKRLRGNMSSQDMLNTKQACNGVIDTSIAYKKGETQDDRQWGWNQEDKIHVVKEVFTSSRDRVESMHGRISMVRVAAFCVKKRVKGSLHV